MIPNQWYAILPSTAVRKNTICAVTRLNLQLALFRTLKGELGCVVDQCAHRGAALSAGKVKDGCIQCPFHGLEFSLDGACRFIPANGIASKADLGRYHVRQYLVKEKAGIIYLWYGEPASATGELPFFNEHVDSSYSWSEIEDHWNSHYSRCIENQLDVVHLPFVHYNTIGRGNRTLVNGPKIEIEGTTIRTSANNEVDNGQKPRPPEECSILDTYLLFKFPNVWMNHISDRIKVIIYFAPVDDENTILYIRFYCKLSPLRMVNNVIAFSGKYANRTIERQDKRVVITQKPKASALKSGERLIPGDRPIVEYRRIREELKERTSKG